MGVEVEQFFVNRIQAGLQRKSIVKCSQWARKYRIMGGDFPGPWSFKYYPWQVAMHDSEAELNVGQKGAQVGFTDTVLNVTFFSLDVKGKDVLYVLPAKTPDATDFSAGRFNPALELSPHLSLLFSDVQNIGHKRAGTRNLYVRGSRARGGLKSVPVGTLILDEVDEMTQDNIPLAFERMSGQKEKRAWMVSTPTTPGRGINAYYERSSQNHYFFPCPSCSRSIELKFPDNLVIVGDSPTDRRINESYLICNECKVTLPHETKYDYLGRGFWVEMLQNDVKGWHINQLYSSTVSPGAIASLYLKSKENKADEQEFYNSKLGITHEVEGSRLTESVVRECIGYHITGSEQSKRIITTLGVDQGRWLHYEATGWTIGPGEDVSAAAFAKVLDVGKRIDFEDLDKLMLEYHINFCVIDSQPERRKATEFAHRFPGRVRLCFYPEGMNTKQISVSDSGNEPTISVDRTTWLDTSLGRFYNKKIVLPQNISNEYIDHMTAQVRIYKNDKNGNPVSRYVTDGQKADHYGHARNYSEIALNLAVTIGQNQDINEW